MNKIIVAALLLLISTPIQAQSSLEDYFKDADSFLKTFVDDGRVAYETIKMRPRLLNKLTSAIAETDLNELNTVQKKAFLINAYNLLTINSIIKNSIPDSPLSVDGFFDKQTHVIAEKKLTLNQIEKEMLLPNHNDARLHFVLVCAAIGCPKLQSHAYVPAKLEDQIQTATVEALNNEYYVRVSDADNKVELSEIFNWYKADFLAESESLLSYVNEFRNIKIPSNYTVAHYTYDWKLNKQ